MNNRKFHGLALIQHANKMLEGITENNKMYEMPVDVLTNLYQARTALIEAEIRLTTDNFLNKKGQKS